MYNVEHKRQVLINQSRSDNGNYYKYLKALYNLFYRRTNELGKGYTTYNDISCKEKMQVVADCYDKAFVRPYIISEYQKDLMRLGYLSTKEVDGELRFYINRELDF